MGIKAELTKTERISSAHVPESKKELRFFLIFCSSYRSFVKGFAQIEAPLHELKVDRVFYRWNEEQMNGSKI